MKKVGFKIQADICNDYYLGMKYKDIMKKYGINRWNIQQALSTFDMKTDRISSPPRLQGGKKKGTLMERYYDGDYFSPLSPYPNQQDGRPLLEDDMDYQERYDADETEEKEFETGNYSEIDVSENDEIRYIRRE